jgi:hypothetical protein
MTRLFQDLCKIRSNLTTDNEQVLVDILESGFESDACSGTDWFTETFAALLTRQT